MTRDQDNTDRFSESVATFRQKEAALAATIIREIKEKEPTCQLAYLENTIPKGKAKYIFITMEPSFGPWAKNEIHAEQMLKRGYRNFLWSTEDFLFRYAISTYLSDNYYITDISKIAMAVENANRMRDFVYPKWISHLKEEISLVGSDDCRVFFVGNIVRDSLTRVFPASKVAGTIIHYSGQAGSKRKAMTIEYPEDYAHFLTHESISKDKIVALASHLLSESKMEAGLANDILARLTTKENILSPSRVQLLFCYFMAFNKEKGSLQKR